MRTFIAGAMTTGQVTASSVQVSMSSPLPFAALPRKFAVAGATTSTAATSASRMCSTWTSPSRSQGSVATFLPVSAAKVMGPTSFVAARVITTVTSWPRWTSLLQRSAPLYAAIEPHTPRTTRRPVGVVGLLLGRLLDLVELDLAGLDLGEGAAERGLALDQAGRALDDFLDAALQERGELEAAADLFVEAVDLADGVESHGSLPPGRNERGNLPHGALEVVIYHDRVVRRGLRHLVAGGREALRDGRRRVRPAAAQPPFELLLRRGGDEDEPARHPVPPQRRRALDVDDQEAGEALADERVHGLARGAVEVA